MKKKIVTLAIIPFIVLAISIACGQGSNKKPVKARENLKEAKKDVVEAKQDLKVALKDSVSEYQEFKKESELKIKNNEQSIADLKVTISKVSDRDKVIYQKKINELELKNANLRKKLYDYKYEDPDKWASFKREFNHDMDELGKALKDFTVNNKK